MAATNPVEHRVTQLHVLGIHVDLGAQHAGAVGELTGLHPAEEVEVLVGGAVSVGRVDTGFAVATALRRDGLAVLVVDVGLAFGNQQFGPFIELVEVVGGVQHVCRLEAEPAHVGDDRVDVLGFLGLGVGVVEAEIADTAEVVRNVEVDGDGLGVPDVQVAVGFRREAGLDSP